MSNPTLPPFTAQELRNMQRPHPGNSPKLYPPPSPDPRPWMPTAPQAESTNNHPRRFDQQTYNQITGLDARLLEQIDYDCKQQAKHSKTGARYSIKSENWYAKVLGVSRETISDHVVKLANLGILEITRRRKVRGQWQTNLYKIKSWIWWKLGKLMRGLKKSPHRVTQESHKASPMRENTIRTEDKGGVLNTFTQEIMDRWTAKGIIKPQPM